MEIVLNTFGVSLNRDNEAFVITKKGERHRIPVDDVKSIRISRGAQITSDAVMLAVEHEIEVMFMDKGGHPIGRVWSPRYGSISTIRKGQLNFTASHAALEWIKEVIMQKMENLQALILLLQPRDTVHERERKRNMERIEDYRNKVSRLDGELVNDVAPTLRGWEGQASRIYFSTIVKYLPEEYQFEQRSQHPAMDVANAFLNYGYGVLYGKYYLEVLKKLKRSGLEDSPVINRLAVRADDLPTLQQRIDTILGLIRQTKKQGGKMLFFVMYDIESNKVRYNIVKYLERMGCYRIQKSIFLFNLSMEKYEQIKKDMVEVQSLYENHDSIIVCPVSSDILRSMKIIGQNINLDVITQNKNTLFF